jgi:surface polysaccharide O-acyltransferase-like enzyme
MILGIYLFIPIIGKWVRGCNDREIVYFLLIWACTLLLNQPILSKLKIGIGLTYFSGYLGYVVLGYYLATKTFKNIKLLNIISTYLILSGLVVTIIGTYLLSSSSGKFNGIFYSYLSPNVLIVSIGIFLVSKNNQAPNQKIFGIVSFISKFSFGIYLIHILVLSVLYKIGINWDFINPIIGIPITSFICLFISGGIVYCVNKLPYGNYVSG